MTISARVSYAAVLRMDPVIEAIVEGTAAIAQDIYGTIPTISHWKTEGKSGHVPHE